MLLKNRSLYEIARSEAQNVRILFVSNIREADSVVDYDGTSVTSEYLSLSQHELILEALREMGYETISFIGENDFMQCCLEHDFYRHDNKICIVVNSAQSGIAIGRKALIPAFCNLNGLWHTNSNPYVVSLARNKFHCDCILASQGFPITVDYLYLPSGGWLSGHSPNIGEKVIAKLNNETSSFGLSSSNVFFYEGNDDHIRALSLTYNQEVIVQSFIEGYEVEVPVVISDDVEVVLPVGITVRNQRNLENQILDYDIRKNLLFGFYDYNEHNPRVASEIETCTKNVVRTLGIEGFGRVDFRINRNGEFFITDIATNPHITKGMSFFYAFEQNGFTYPQMLETLLGVTIKRYKRSH